MAITFTNHVKTIKDALHFLLVEEFKPTKIVMAKEFDPGHISDGEYIRYFLVDQPILEFHSDGETREYTYDGSYYFDEKRYNFSNIFDDLVSPRIERFKRLLHNNRSYAPSNAYKWHHLELDIAESFYLTEDEDVETPYPNILNVPFELRIIRSDFN